MWYTFITLPFYHAIPHQHTIISDLDSYLWKLELAKPTKLTKITTPHPPAESSKLHQQATMSHFRANKTTPTNTHTSTHTHARMHATHARTHMHTHTHKIVRLKSMYFFLFNTSALAITMLKLNERFLVCFF